MAKSNKHLAAAVGAAFLAGGAAQFVQADSNPFGATPLESGYELAHFDKHGEGSCGGEKGGEGKCGEGKCGGEKGGEGSCGGEKGGEGSCGAEKGGEGSCGSA